MAKVGPIHGALKDVPLLILAGGRATRLRGLSSKLPKYLMPVSPNECFADLHLKWAYEQGFRQVFLGVGHLADAIRDYCGNGARWSLDIQYVDDGEHPQGTGGAVALSLAHSYNYLAITYGDTLLSLNATDLFQKVIAARAGGLMTLYPLDLKGHRANSTQEGPYARYSKEHPRPDWTLIDYGFLFLSRELIAQFPSHRPLDLAEPLENFCQLDQILASVCSERFWEIGSPESLFEFQQRFQNRT